MRSNIMQSLQWWKTPSRVNVVIASLQQRHGQVVLSIRMAEQNLNIIFRVQFPACGLCTAYSLTWLFINWVRLTQVYAKKKIHTAVMFAYTALPYDALIHLYNIINFWLVSLLCGLFLMQLSELVSRETIERLRKLCQSLFVWIMNMTW